MADFYRERRKAQQDITEWIERNEVIAKAAVCLKISQRYGFSQLFVDKILKLLEETGTIKEEDGHILNIHLIEKRKKEEEKNDLSKQEHTHKGEGNGKDRSRKRSKKK